jgi:hypothetical protein
MLHLGFPSSFLPALCLNQRTQHNKLQSSEANLLDVDDRNCPCLPTIERTQGLRRPCQACLHGTSPIWIRGRQSNRGVSPSCEAKATCQRLFLTPVWEYGAHLLSYRGHSQCHYNSPDIRWLFGTCSAFLQLYKVNFRCLICA